MKRSQAQERRGAASFGGTVNSGSGNGEWRKNDVLTPEFSIEFKRTDKKQYTFKSAELLTAEKHALLDGRIMLFGIELGGRNYVLLTEEDFHSMRGS